jgi:hypothetical protein
VLGLALVLAQRPEPLAAAAKVGSEFQVNSYTPARQRFADVAVESDGDFVVVWESNQQDRSLYGIFGQRFDSAGVRTGGEFQINLRTVLTQVLPDVATDAAGNFVVAWEGDDQDGDGRGIFVRRFASDGNAVGGEFQVNVYTTSMQRAPAIAVDAEGDFVVAWHSVTQDGDLDGVFGRRFASSGEAQGGEFQVNVYTTSRQLNPSVGLRSDGGFVVVWQSEEPNPLLFGVVGRHFDSNGGALGGEFQVNVATLSQQFVPRVAIGPMNDFVVAWESFQDGENRGVFLRRFDSSGSASGGEIQVNTFTMDAQYGAALDIADDGSFVVAWTSLTLTGSGSGVFAQAFDSAANPVGAEFQVNTRTEPDQSSPRLAIADDGDVVVSWQGPDGSLDGIFAQRFTPGSSIDLDIDLDGAVEPLTDGLLVLRGLFGFTGDALITGAIDLANCTRCTAPAIEAYLASILAALDIDADDEIEALTDGLLVLRWLFGFDGPALVTGAVDLTDCTRCTATEIEGYLQTLTP